MRKRSSRGAAGRLATWVLGGGLAIAACTGSPDAATEDPDNPPTAASTATTTGSKDQPLTRSTAQKVVAAYTSALATAQRTRDETATRQLQDGRLLVMTLAAYRMKVDPPTELDGWRPSGVFLAASSSYPRTFLAYEGTSVATPVRSRVTVFQQARGQAAWKAVAVAATPTNWFLSTPAVTAGTLTPASATEARQLRRGLALYAKTAAAGKRSSNIGGKAPDDPLSASFAQILTEDPARLTHRADCAVASRLVSFHTLDVVAGTEGASVIANLSCVEETKARQGFMVVLDTRPARLWAGPGEPDRLASTRARYDVTVVLSRRQARGLDLDAVTVQLTGVSGQPASASTARA